MFKTLLVNLINFIFELQNKILNRKHENKTSFASSKTSMSKNKMTSGASLTLNSELEKNKQKVFDEVTKIAQNNINDFKNIFNIPKEKGVNFYSVKNGEKFLKIINEESGLIFHKKGFQAFYLNLLTTRKFSFKSPVMFVFDVEKISAYNILYHFYKWYAYENKLPGFEEKTLSQFKHIYEYETNLDKLTYEEIINLKHAIQRDKEAMDFVLNFMKNIEASKKAFGALKNNDGGANV